MFRRASILLFLAATLLGQHEDDPYFSLSSFATFPSNGKPEVAVNAANIDSLTFRVYRVQDPVRFFAQMNDGHQFGEERHLVPRPRTFLERFRAWKRDLRREIRRELRAQFDGPPSSHFAKALPNASAPARGSAPHVTTYAEIPVLNPQQLVLSFVRPVKSPSRWRQEDVEIPVKEKGLYVVEAVRRNLAAYTILTVTDIVMISKKSDARIIHAVVDRQTGQPIPAIPIVSIRAGEQVGSLNSDANGLAVFPKPLRDETIFVARRGRDIAVHSAVLYGDRSSLSGYLYTDRPVYRPGHTVHFKGLLRERGAAGYAIPSLRTVDVEIVDSDQKTVYQKTLDITPSGAIHDELVLDRSARLGHYYIQIRQDDLWINGDFEVEEYRKPEYKVTVTPASPRVVQGQEISATIEARYFFGEPVARAKVEYTIHRTDWWSPLWYDPEDQDDFRLRDDTDYGYGSDQISEEHGELDEDGRLTIRIPTTPSDKSRDARYRIEVHVTDDALRSISGTGYFVATWGSYQLQVTSGSYMARTGETVAFGVTAMDYDGQPVRARSHVDLSQIKYRGSGGGVGETLASIDVDLSGREPKNVTFTMPQQGGLYEVRATSTTPEGRRVTTIRYVWVTGGNWFKWDPDEQVQIVSDQKTYKAGDTAHLMVLAPAGAAVLVAVEGSDIREYRMLKSTASGLTFDFPVTPVDEPGMTVTATWISDGKLYSGQKYLRVPPLLHTLNAKLTTNKPQYLPGEAADYTLEVTDLAGKPVPNAEFSLGVVDEAIYSVRPDSTESIVSFFFRRNWNQVTTETSLQYYFAGYAGKKRMQLAAIKPRSRLAQLKPESLVQPKVRKAFPDTAFWTSELTTDKQGRAHAKVEFPDSLTTWRATARGSTSDTRVGSAILKTIVRKNLILRLASPRFLVQGDEVVISAIVHNYLTDSKTARVSLDLTGLDVVSGGTRDVQVPSRGEVRVDWRVKAQGTRRAVVTAKALTNEESDAIEMEMPINPPGVQLAQAKGGGLTAGGLTAFEFTYPSGTEPGSRTISIRTSPSVAGTLLNSVGYLTAFPYGCVEQTMSSFLPNIIVREAVTSLNLQAPLNKEELNDKIYAGLDRLYGFQHEDGGWGWWKTDETHPFMTAYVVAGLAQARNSRAITSGSPPVKEDVIKRGVTWLRDYVVRGKKLDGDLRAYVAYALAVAGQPDADLFNEIYRRQDELSGYGLALLGLALEPGNDARVPEIASLLEKRVTQDGEEASWPTHRDAMLDFAVDATPEATAYVVKFLSHVRKDSPLLPKAATWLMNHRNEGYWWSSTKQTAMVIYGLTDYLKIANELTPDLTVKAYVNDTEVLSRTFNSISVPSPELILDDSKLRTGTNRIRIETSGKGRLYYSARAEYYSRAPQLERTGSVDLNLLRDYYRLEPRKQGNVIVHDLVPLKGPVSTGDVLAVRLVLTGRTSKYLLIEDPIPAGAEFVEKDHLYELSYRPPWWSHGYARREMHDDHMALFQTLFSQGQSEFFYLLKVNRPGTFNIGPARVAPMYQRGVQATTESRVLEVR